MSDPLQPDLVELDDNWVDVWKGMPSYAHEDLMPDSSVIVHFRSQADRRDFAALVGQQLTAKTKSIWHPKAEIKSVVNKVFTRATKVTPRYPVYVISKGRADTRKTSRSLEWIGVPYHIVVEPQEYDQYAAVIDPKKILTLPFSNLGLGGIPARNWVWEHSIAAGAERHWILDDNISGFARWQGNLKIEVDNGATFCAAEDFVDRYENLVMAAFQYDYFAPNNKPLAPVVFNTRCYSGILLSNAIPHRWRGRYNEDTDLSLNILKDGLCTAYFNAFLMYKQPTMTMKGGNTDELYAGMNVVTAAWESHAKVCAVCGRCVDGYGGSVAPCEEGRAILEQDGRWRMAEHLRAQHPERVTIERKWGRWQHQVDYRAFSPRLGRNVPRLKAGIVIPDGVNEYGMVLGAMPEDSGYQEIEKSPKASLAPLREAPRTAGERPAVSALDFLARLPQAQQLTAPPSDPPAARENAPAPPVEALLDSPRQFQTASQQMTVGSLFAGIGGFDLGFERAGYKVLWQVEIDPFCQKVLAKHWPQVKRYDDVQRVGAELGYVDIICGGFPCQDISLAGDGEGIDEGEQSGLWREYIRIVRLLRPRYVVVENVAALLLRGVHRVLGDLAASGYDAEWDCLPASAFGAPHRRDRIWLVAYPRQDRIQRVFQEPLSRFAGFSWCQDVRGVEDLRRRSDLPPPLFRGAGDGVPDWVDRVGACGNAVVSDVVQWIAERIKECDELSRRSTSA